ncbi:MAG: YdiY family protein [Gemmatimonadales bacterium]
MTAGKLSPTPLVRPFAFGALTVLTAVAALASPLASSLLAQDATKPKTTFTGDLGYVSASGNTNITTLSLGEKLIHSDSAWTFTQLAAYVYGKTDAKESANQLRFAGRVDYALGPRIGVFAGASWERNAFAGFNSRTDEIAGFMWKAIVAPDDALGLDAGGVLTQESDVDGTSQSYPSLRVAMNYKHSFTKTAYFQQLAEYVPNLQTSGAYRVNTESAVVAPVSAHVGVKVSYVLRYDSRPPVKFGTTDRVLTTGVQISY